ncbi:phytanoyl-CoA dioxygenase family protein [Aliikangiella sp. IMCC44359]|uniref:phytanoyl-CoA dioxygenase family protein n=1 Tax=Aliikangiella sp. IMCC44359 TaxID=3459125 RepID=UPI00403B3700
MFYQNNGYDIKENFLSKEWLNSLDKELADIGLTKSKGGIRQAEKKFSSIASFINSTELLYCAASYLKAKPSLVRVILFDKTQANNWSVGWHQDKTVTLSQQIADETWGPWSIKEGIYHVQPPLTVLENMLTLRIHLDDTNDKNGCLRLIPKTHQLGILSKSKIYQWVEQCTPIDIELTRGGLLVMSPLIVHSSCKAINNCRRRVLHIEFSSYPLPDGIFWEPMPANSMSSPEISE